LVRKNQTLSEIETQLRVFRLLRKSNLQMLRGIRIHARAKI
jgi:hypothetical protein